MNPIIEDLRSELIINADEEVKKSGERFFREAVQLYGIKSAVVIKIGKEHYSHLKKKSKPEIFSLCEELWKSGIYGGILYCLQLVILCA